MKHRVGRVEKPQSVDAGPRLPQFVHDFLGGGAPEGSRNETLHRCAQQYFWARLSIEEAKRDLLPAALRCGLKEGEATQAIMSGYRSGPGEPIRTSAPAPALRPVSPGDDFLRALRAAFNAGELIAISDAKFDTESGKWRPDRAVIKTREEWEDHHKRLPIHKYITGEGGGYIAINPLVSKEGGRKNANVAAYRHVLAEFDGGSLDEQRAKLEASGFPISVIVTSGKRSVHGWIRVDAKDKQEWENRRDHIFRTLECDPKNKDLARVSRCPGVDRVVDGKKCRQELLAVQVGPKTWSGGDDLPELLNLASLTKVVAAGDGLPDLIKGLLCVRSKMMVAGPSKARKSWTLLDLALSIASGSNWIGLQCRQGKVIFIDGELHREQILSRLLTVAKSKELPPSQWEENLQIWPMRGEMRDVSSLVGALMATLMREKPAALFFDPIYKLLGERDENSAGDINSLLNELERVSRSVGCSIIYSHHYAKGDAGEKSPQDRASGSGVWARDPDAMAFFTPPPKPKDKKSPPPNYDFQVEFVARGHAPTPPARVTWKVGHFVPERSGVMTYRMGSKAEQHGKILEHMPRLSRTCGRNGEGIDKCELIQWIARACELSSKEAFNTYEVLRHDRYDILKCEGEGVWVGTKFAENNPF